jgi:hypothetical protein
MKPATLNITIYQGSTYQKSFQWSTGEPSAPVNLTGCKIRMQIREKYSSPDVILELNTDNGRIVITDPVLGKFAAEISAADTTELRFKAAVYDLEVEFPGTPPKVKRIIQGSVALSLEVTR